MVWKDTLDCCSYMCTCSSEETKNRSCFADSSRRLRQSCLDASHMHTVQALASEMIRRFRTSSLRREEKIKVRVRVSLNVICDANVMVALALAGLFAALLIDELPSVQ